MAFPIQSYLCFLLVALLLFYTVKKENRLYVLIPASILFIAAVSLRALAFVLVFAIFNYFLAIKLEQRISDAAIKRKLFWTIISLDIGILFLFKYVFVFSAYTTGRFSLAMPIGLSYYTFQVLGYVIRINRQSEKAQRNFGAFLLYIAFFPKFLSGPVERSNHFFPQLTNWKQPDQAALFTSARIFGLGLFKKVVISDNLYDPLFTVYSDVHHYSGLSLIIVVCFQTIYMYADFSGYSDMAAGTAGLFGIKLIDNFNRPFLSKSITEYWKRWHISLSSWCNDFIYNPFIVKYRRLGNKAVIPGLFLTFFIVGIWHGANFTFVILGLLQAIAITYENYTKRRRLKISSKLNAVATNTISRIIVFFFMSFSMIFFFSASVADAWYLVAHLPAGIQLAPDALGFIKDKPAFAFALLNFVALFIAEMVVEKRKCFSLFPARPSWIMWAAYLYGLSAIYFSYAPFHPFYYMRF